MKPFRAAREKITSAKRGGKNTKNKLRGEPCAELREKGQLNNKPGQ